MPDLRFLPGKPQPPVNGATIFDMRKPWLRESGNADAQQRPIKATAATTSLRKRLEASIAAGFASRGWVQK